MMSSLIESWVAFGFTEYEAKTYVSLLQLGPATGYQIAKASGVPRSMIYEVLNRLVGRGAVLTQSLANQVRYAAVPPEQLAQRMQREMEDNLNALQRDLQSLSRPASDLGTTWNVTGRRNVLAFARQMIERGQREIALAVGDDDELDQLLPYLHEAQQRGLSLVIMSPVAYDTGAVPVRVCLHGQALRQAAGHGFTLVVDAREALMGEVDRSESAVWTTNGYAVGWILWSLKYGLKTD
jgi:sugar-specific transcriptional regulator TrmB